MPPVRCHPIPTAVAASPHRHSTSFQTSATPPLSEPPRQWIAVENRARPDRSSSTPSRLERVAFDRTVGVQVVFQRVVDLTEFERPLEDLLARLVVDVGFDVNLERDGLEFVVVV